MQKWDYRVAIFGEENSWSEIQDALGALGRDGWELYTITPDLHSNNAFLYIFKKPLEE